MDLPADHVLPGTLYFTVTPEMTIVGGSPALMTWAHTVLYGGSMQMSLKLGFMQCMPRSFQASKTYFELVDWSAVGIVGMNERPEKERSIIAEVTPHRRVLVVVILLV